MEAQQDKRSNLTVDPTAGMVPVSKSSDVKNQESLPVERQAMKPWSWFLIIFASILTWFDAWTKGGDPSDLGGAFAQSLVYISFFGGIAYLVKGRRKNRDWNSFARWYFWSTIILLSLMHNTQRFQSGR